MQIIPAELYRQEARSTGMALAQGVMWLSNIMLSLAFLHFQVLSPSALTARPLCSALLCSYPFTEPLLLPFLFHFFSQ